MTELWGPVLTELAPLALVIALSPLSIIPAVLALHTDRPRPTGLAFLAGWLVGLAALVSLFVVASDLVGSLDKPPSLRPATNPSIHRRGCASSAASPPGVPC